MALRSRSPGVALCLALAGLLARPAVLAQDAGASEPKRPKICLVLSGGGARGAAHVGVLKVLEELRVPIDCIAGTSMGSIVGAAYASGTPLDEMERTLEEMTSRRLFKDLPPREERALRLKRDDSRNLAPIEFGLRDGELMLPKGLVSGVQLEGVLRSLIQVRGAHRFDALPIPFRAVATDLVSGRPVVLSQGELAGAMRASMAVPGAIQPARVEGQLLVDGGLTNNLPVDVARAMGADIVIAVNLGTPLLKSDELTSLLGVTNQMVNILTEQNVKASLASLKPTDILILPQLADFSAADFDHLADVVPLGESAARVATDLLVRLSLPPAPYAAWQKRRLAGTQVDPAPVDAIRFAPMEHVNPEIARSMLETAPGAAIDSQTLDRDMRRLYGMGDFERVNYQLLDEPGGRVLAIEATEKAWGPNYLRLGLALSSDFRGDAYFDFLVSHRRPWLNSLGGEWRNDLQFGRNNRIATEFYQPLTTSQTFFVVPAASYERHPTDIFRGDQRIARYDISKGRLAVEAGAQFTKYGELRLGLEHAQVHAALDTGPIYLVPPEGRPTYASVTLRGLVDQLDNVDFPRDGYAVSLNLGSAREALGSDANFSRGDITGMLVRSFGEHTFSVSTKFAGRLGSERLPATEMFHWGGLLQQSGYPTGALTGEELLFGRIVYTRRLARWSLLEGITGGISYEVGRMNRPLVPDNEPGILRSFALLLGIDTGIGPLYVGYGRAERGYESLYLYLGKP